MRSVDEESELASRRRSSRSVPAKEAESGESALDFVTLGSMTEGYSAADLIDLVGSATQQAMIRSARSGDSQVS